MSTMYNKYPHIRFDKKNVNTDNNIKNNIYIKGSQNLEKDLELLINKNKEYIAFLEKKLDNKINILEINSNNIKLNQIKIEEISNKLEVISNKLEVIENKINYMDEYIKKEYENKHLYTDNLLNEYHSIIKN